VTAIPPSQDEMTRFRVLLAEDDADARDLLAKVLISFSHVVIAKVATGREAVIQAKLHFPDAVLLDVHMPDGSGIEAAEQITRANPGTVVILFTGDPALALDAHQVEVTSAVAFLPKPTPPAILDGTLRLAMQRAKERDHAVADAELKLAERKTIERAKGILMKLTGATEEDAFRRMQRASQTLSISVFHVARDIEAHEWRPLARELLEP
jgi:AmiR/NasT family two-component response regulator